MKEERRFVAEKLAYRPRVVFMVLLFSPVSWRTNPDISRLAEEMDFDGIYDPRETRLDTCTASFCVLDVQIYLLIYLVTLQQCSTVRTASPALATLYS